MLYYWLYAVSYTLQIYFDFSGYSDMAIGLGAMFGFRFLEISTIRISPAPLRSSGGAGTSDLSTWFRDYVYIPLGGNRVKRWKWVRNILVVWAV